MKNPPSCEPIIGRQRRITYWPFSSLHRMVIIIITIIIIIIIIFEKPPCQNIVLGNLLGTNWIPSLRPTCIYSTKFHSLIYMLDLGVWIFYSLYLQLWHTGQHSLSKVTAWVSLHKSLGQDSMSHTTVPLSHLQVVHSSTISDSPWRMGVPL